MRDIQELYVRRADRVAAILAAVPFIRMVGLNGSLVRGEARPESDIDFLIIAAPGRLFMVRFITTVLVHLLGLRRHGQMVAGRICLNRYQTSDSLDIVPHNRYHAEVFSRLEPLCDIENCYKEYRKINQWVKQFGLEIKEHKNRTSRSSFVARHVRRIGEWLLAGRLGNWLEKELRNIQVKLIAANPLTRHYPDRIKVADNMLLFHPPAPGEIDADLARWDAAADAYDIMQGRGGDPFRRLVLDPIIFRFLNKPAGLKILDAGCGNGYFTNLLVELGADAVGVDGSQVMVARASQNFPARLYKKASLLEPLPWSNETFDVIVSSMVIQDITDPVFALKELSRVLNRSGHIILAIPHPCFTYPVSRARRGFWDRIFDHPPRLVVDDYVTDRRVVAALPGIPTPTTRYHRTFETYFSYFKSAGLEVIELIEPIMTNSAGNLGQFKIKKMFVSDKIPLAVVFNLRHDR